MGIVRSQRWSDPETGCTVVFDIEDLLGATLFVTTKGGDIAGVRSDLFLYPVIIQKAVINFLNAHPNYAQYIS